VERDGHTILTFEVSNPNAAPLPYVGYLTNAFEGGLKEGVIAPLYKVEVKNGTEWKPMPLSWCGKGLGEVAIPANGKGTFTVLRPAGEWDAVRFGVTWYAGPDRKQAQTAWGAVDRKDGAPKKAP
jgi:hypothetical protein